MKMLRFFMSNLCFSLIGCLLTKTYEFGLTNLKQRNDSIETLCATSCFCGLLRHPMQAAMNNDTILSRFPEDHFSLTQNDDVITRWFKEMLPPSVALSFPAKLVFCHQQQNLQQLPEVTGRYFCNLLCIYPPITRK